MNRCPHGVYHPEGHAIAFCCQMCNPVLDDPTAKQPEMPKFNRRGSMDMTLTGRLPKCPNCQGHSLLTVSNDGKCTICGHEFEIGVVAHLRANNRQPGLCPSCGSGVHFDRSGRLWECADCGVQYKAPKKIQ